MKEPAAALACGMGKSKAQNAQTIVTPTGPQSVTTHTAEDGK